MMEIGEICKNIVIENFLSETDFGLDFLLVPWRIEKMIASKRITVVREEDSGENFRQRIIIRSDI